jgi:hypothetical protein
MKLKYILLFVAAILSSFVGALQADVPAQSANEPTGLNNVTLWIYPEYDDPRLLIMMEGQATGVNLPAQIRFLVPSAAEMYSAGSKDAQGIYTGGPPDRKPSQITGWDEISYELKNPTFRMEYYDPVIRGQIEKTIAFDFQTIFPIGSLETIVQVPTAASNFKVTPAGTKTTEGNFTVYTSRYNTLNVGLPLHFDIAYTKSDPNPSLGGSPPPSPASGSWNLLPFAILAGVIIIAGTFIWAVKATRKDKFTLKNQTDRSHHKANKPTQLRSKFCNQCGKPLEFPSKFCPYCRHKLDS